MTSSFIDTDLLRDQFDIDDNVDDAQLFNAEYVVLQRYIEPTPTDNNALGTFPQLSVANLKPRLRGFVGTISDPDIDEMDDVLVYSIRQTISNYINYNDRATKIKKVEQGEQSVTYQNNVQSRTISIYRPLRIYDNRDRHHYL